MKKYEKYAILFIAFVGICLYVAGILWFSFYYNNNEIYQETCTPKCFNITPGM